MILATVSPYFQKRLERLSRWASTPSLWRDHADKLLDAADEDLIHADDAMDLLHRIQRLEWIFSARMENNQLFRDQFYRGTFPTWCDFVSPPAPKHLQKGLADQLYNVQNDRDVPMLEIGDHARAIGCFLFDKCIHEGVDFDVSIFDENFKATLLNNCDDIQAASFGETYALMRSHITTRVVALYNLPEHCVVKIDPEKKKIYDKSTRIFREWILSGRIHYTLTSIPTRVDAEVDGLDYEQYITDYFTMCNQDWPAIEAAQEKLIEVFNPAKTLRFTNNDGTDLTMDVEDFTFCNSVVARNIPGSEVFSAPRRDSVNGTIVAKGRFAVKNTQGEIIEDITMHFKDGYMHDYDIGKGKEIFESVIGTDEGARYVGEIGIGTNPFWKTHVASILLAEKIGGSFHVALGDAYTYTDYMGTPVKVDNGNRSRLHWDITTMLWGKEGKIYADDALIMDDGQWIAPELSVLNGVS
ncbi:MAG: leucyl aminopeptidase [Alphaproteobacteria bacterium]|nr:MAG: leucyl aminopeptidase [Alphaproteobacteria bacterium]